MKSDDMSSTPELSGLADFNSWARANRDRNFGLLDYAYHLLTPDLAIATASLFAPKFLLYEGAIFLAEAFRKDIVDQWMEHFHADINAVERVVNCLAMGQLMHCARDLSAPNLKYLGSVLMICWECALKRQFPDRRFQIQGEWDEENEDFVICFWQVPIASGQFGKPHGGVSLPLVYDYIHDIGPGGQVFPRESNIARKALPHEIP